MFLNVYLFIANFNKRIKKSKAPAMKKRTHLRAKVQRVLIMKKISVGNATSYLIYSFLKSLVLDTIIGIRHIHSTSHNSSFCDCSCWSKTAILAIGPKLIN